jgi:septum site-determining protein MinD
MSRITLITSGKGGVGKTTAAAAIGAGLAAAGKRTAIVDLDLGLRNLDVSLGLETQVFWHIGDVLKGTVSLENALISSDRYPGLMLLAAAQTVRQETLTKEALQRVLTELSGMADQVLIDSPAGIGECFQMILPLVDEGIVVTAPVVSAVRDADKVLHLMEAAGVKYRFVIVNMLRQRLMKNGVMMTPEDIRDVLGTPLLGVIPEDEEAIVCCNTGVPLVTVRCMSGSALKRIAERVRGTALSLPRLNARRKGLFHA